MLAIERLLADKAALEKKETEIQQQDLAEYWIYDEVEVFWKRNFKKNNARIVNEMRMRVEGWGKEMTWSTFATTGMLFCADELTRIERFVNHGYLSV
jgi:hypothetical protein